MGPKGTRALPLFSDRQDHVRGASLVFQGIVDHAGLQDVFRFSLCVTLSQKLLDNADVSI